jgi:hypothetical protein
MKSHNQNRVTRKDIVNMNITFNDFIEKAPQYSKFKNNKQAEYIFVNIICKEINIIKMIELSDAGKPALSICIEEIDRYYEENLKNNNVEFDLKNNFDKQCLGMMVKTILNPFGYFVLVQRDIPKSFKSKYLKSATVYKNLGENPSMRIVKNIETVTK